MLLGTNLPGLFVTLLKSLVLMLQGELLDKDTKLSSLIVINMNLLIVGLSFLGLALFDCLVKG